MAQLRLVKLTSLTLHKLFCQYQTSRDGSKCSYLGGGETEDGQAGVLRATESSLLGQDDKRHDDEPGQQVRQRQRHDEQVGDRVAQVLVSKCDEYEGAVAEDHQYGEYRQRDVLQHQLLV